MLKGNRVMYSGRLIRHPATFCLNYFPKTPTTADGMIWELLDPIGSYQTVSSWNIFETRNIFFDKSSIFKTRNSCTPCSCVAGGKCLRGHSHSLCVCPLGRMGNECYGSFDPCSQVQCEHGGTCLPTDYRLDVKSRCLCSKGFYGSRCQWPSASIDLHFSHPIHRSASVTMFVHFLQLTKDRRGLLLIENRQLHKRVPLNKVFRLYNHNQKFLSPFLLLQIFFEADQFSYYIATALQTLLTNISTILVESNRCPHVDQLLINRTIREFPLIKKVKFYHHVCQMRSDIRWFHDEAHLCFCYKDRLPDCLFFARESPRCATDYCHNHGQCVQNNFNGIWDFSCVCRGCAYGSLCQLTTSEYVLSLDAMLGQDILENVLLVNQPILIKVVFTVVILMLVLGFVSNLLSFFTFRQSKIQEFGCGIYLFYLCLVGQLGLSIFAGRFFYLLGTQLFHVEDRSQALWTCIALEYLLSVVPMLFDWLTACVAVERSMNMIKGVTFDKSQSVWWAKRILILLTLLVLASAWHEPFIHQLIDDPRAMTMHTWCVVIFPWSWLRNYRLTINLINLIVPGSINLLATAFLLHKSTRMKQSFINKQNEKSYFKSFKKILPQYGSPFGLALLSLMRLIFSFTLVCIVHHWQKYVYLTAYFISFAPLMGTFPIFVLPAKTYNTEFKNFLNRTKKKLTMRKTS